MNRSLASLVMILGMVCWMITPVSAGGTPQNVAPNDAQNAIDSAQEALIDAYKAVADAERAGANVTQLIGDLNHALDLIEEARDCYRNGDYTKSHKYATRAESFTIQIVQRAQKLGEEARQAAIYTRYATIGLLICGAFLAYAVGRRGWRKWRERSQRKVLKMRVGGAESE